jgi:hypothetical protein
VGIEGGLGPRTEKLDLDALQESNPKVREAGIGDFMEEREGCLHHEASRVRRNLALRSLILTARRRLEDP